MLALPDNELPALYAESVLLRGVAAYEAKVAACKEAAAPMGARNKGSMRHHKPKTLELEPEN